jgi:hypothetical protein
MSSHEAKLTSAVLAAQELTPQILRNVIKAHHGPKMDRPARLRIAITKTRELLGQLEATELNLKWRKDDAA